ncbi:ADP-ribosylglycohydrolase family protein [Halomonas sp.]|uniref:ADP-ribosylglycohydrolase family protein n=1 Tax=Halomonas sp. TaxID=1486246 RepID=UPI003D1319D6
MPSLPTLQDRFTGCLLGGAVGDALGAPVEFVSRQRIHKQFGPQGISDYAPAFGGFGVITDDTQMTLFTAEGLLRADVRGSMRGMCHPPSVIAHAYLRWLVTQGGEPTQEIREGLLDHSLEEAPGWLIQQRELHHRRAPGNTCLTALQSMTRLGDKAINNSKGCGGVMRVAPVGLYLWPSSDVGAAFELACESAAITHAHPSGILPAGVLAAVILQLLHGITLRGALELAMAELQTHADHEETSQFLITALELADSNLPPEQAISFLGEGWVAEEALAIAVYCTLVAEDFRHGVMLAVNHDGDSDSTGAIAGNLLGVMLGVKAIPSAWLAPLELREVISEMAQDLLAVNEWDVDEMGGKDNDWVWEKYPGF